VATLSIFLVVQFLGVSRLFASQIACLKNQYLLKLWVAVDACQLVDIKNLVYHHG
jgi:hypothetical protein